VEFAYDGGGLGKGGTVTLYTDGQKVGEGRVEMTQPFGFSADESFDVGMESGSPVSPDYGPRGNAFNGEIRWLEIDVDKAALDEDHILTGAERFRVAMALQ
jgi:arylsulfatase